jgi:hypothetical protein
VPTPISAEQFLLLLSKNYTEELHRVRLYAFSRLIRHRAALPGSRIARFISSIETLLVGLPNMPFSSLTDRVAREELEPTGFDLHKFDAIASIDVERLANVGRNCDLSSTGNSRSYHPSCLQLFYLR